MTNAKTTKKALLTSAVALLLCFGMLMGTTFAWFTDSAASGSNVITAGNLDIVVEYTLDGTTWNDLDGATDLFKKGLWEPGHTEVVAIKVTNNGTLALKYMANMNILKEFVGKTATGADIKLSEILTVDSLVTKDAGVVSSAFADDSAIAGTTRSSFKNANILADSETLLEKDEFDYIIVKVDMAETVGNEANHNGTDIPAIEFGLNFLATQYTYEKDSFGDQYDVDSKYPIIGSVNVPAETVTPTLITAGDVSVYIPAMANEGEYKLEVANESVTTGSNGTTVSYDISLFRDGAKVSGVIFPVHIEIGQFLNILELSHNGNAIADYTYDATTGIISFETDSFGPFSVTYVSALGDDAEVENGKIVGGTFDSNPAALDPSLAEEGSEYIAIDYMENGNVKFVVAKRSTTVVLAPAATDTINKNYTVQAANGLLYKKISDLQNNEYSTVYLLPGTYNEGTTINVYSSMDIIGLGDKDSVKVVKTSSSSSNRHLFNCNGTKAEYIQVTLRNLYLDATVQTTNNKDNAAVQCIRKTKVKCYDLTIVKSTSDLSAVAFYVNGNNAVDGVKYPAYLYVENCDLNTTRTFGIVTTAGTYKFYHSDLTYNGGTAYTNNSGSIKNQAMAPDVWEW